MAGLLEGLKLRHVSEEIEQAEQCKLGEWTGVNARSRGERDIGSIKPCPLQELANAGARGLNPPKPRRILWKVGWIGPIKIE
jgi:hypothetical protein